MSFCTTKDRDQTENGKRDKGMVVNKIPTPDAAVTVGRDITEGP